MSQPPSSRPGPGPAPPLEPPEVLPEQAVSLDELTAAFAQAMGYPVAGEGDEVRQTLPETVAASAPAGEIPGDTDSAGDTASGITSQSPSDATAVDGTVLDLPAAVATPVSPGGILEAMLFVGKRTGAPLTPQEAADLMRGVTAAEIPELVQALNRRYQALDSAMEIVEEGSGYRMTLRRAFAALREQFYGRTREARLSQAALDILAIVAYRQPITAADVGQIRGRPAGPILMQLVRRQLLRIERPNAGGQAPVYRTATRFLELFSLGSLGDLPQSEDLDRL